MDTPTIRCRFEGGALIPVSAWAARQAAEAMRDGDVVLIAIDHPRSMNSHRHQFAEIKAMFEHLPEADQHQPWAANPDALRKHALIAVGYRDEFTVDCGSKAAAERVLPRMVDAERRAHGYAIGQLREPIIRIWTPQSQSVRAMGGAEFQRSKQAVLDWIEDRCGVTLAQVEAA